VREDVATVGHVAESPVLTPILATASLALTPTAELLTLILHSERCATLPVCGLMLNRRA